MSAFVRNSMLDGLVAAESFHELFDRQILLDEIFSLKSHHNECPLDEDVECRSPKGKNK